MGRRKAQAILTALFAVTGTTMDDLLGESERRGHMGPDFRYRCPVCGASRFRSDGAVHDHMCAKNTKAGDQ